MVFLVAPEGIIDIHRHKDWQALLHFELGLICVEVWDFFCLLCCVEFGWG